MTEITRVEEYQVPEAALKRGIADVRKRFFDDFDQEKDHYDLDYVEKIRADDDLLGCYLWHQKGNADKALEQLKSNTKWRKDIGLKDIKITNLKQELLKAGPVYPNKWDINGHPIMLIAVNRAYRDSETNPDKQRLILFWTKTILKTSKDRKLTLFFDCNSVGISNMDIEIVLFITNTMLNNFPNCLGHIIVYNMPRIFNVAWQLVKVILPSHYRPKVKFVNKETVRVFVTPECLPERMGGEVPDYYDYENFDETDATEISRI